MFCILLDLGGCGGGALVERLVSSEPRVPGLLTATSKTFIRRTCNSIISLMSVHPEQVRRKKWPWVINIHSSIQSGDIVVQNKMYLTETL